MEELDIKYIWKTAYENDADIKHYSLNDIHEYRKKKSKLTSNSSRISILFDIIIKSFIILELIYLSVIHKYQYTYEIIAPFIIIITLMFIFLEIGFIKKLNRIKETDSVIANLKEKLYYLKNTYKKFIFIAALSSSLFFISGVFLYNHFKYGKILTSSPFEDPVLYILMILAFIISLFAQWSYYKIQLNELKESIEEFGDVHTAAIKIEETVRRRRIYIIVASILALIGILILLLILKM